MFGRDYVYEPRYVDHGHPFWEWLVPVLLLGLLAAAAIWLAWRLASARPGSAAPSPTRDPAIEELRMRYARGEVSTEEYSTIATGLGAAAAPPVPWPAAAQPAEPPAEQPGPPAA